MKILSIKILCIYLLTTNNTSISKQYLDENLNENAVWNNINK